MSMRIQIKQSCFVKPAEDTPKKSLWISDLDLLVERTHFPTVYFYKPNNNDVSSNFFEAQVLKEALSKALVLFYPVAGRLGINENGRIEIQCNGEGVLFVEAETDFAIDDFKDFTPRLEFQKLVPNPAVDHSSNISSHPLLVLQVLPNTPFAGKYTYVLLTSIRLISIFFKKISRMLLKGKKKINLSTDH